MSCWWQFLQGCFPVLGADISSRDVIEMMMITQYFDMLKDIGMNSTGGAIFLPHSPGNVADVSSEVILQPPMHVTGLLKVMDPQPACINVQLRACHH